MNKASYVAAAVGFAMTMAAASSSAQVIDNRPVSFGIMGGGAFRLAGFRLGSSSDGTAVRC